MTIIHAIILGIVEGVTEFLPISSTAHLIIASSLLGLQNTDFLKSFEIIIQLGAILAVIIYYFKILIKNFEVWKKIIAAFIPTGIIGLILYKIIKQYVAGSTTFTIWALLIGGIILIAFEMWHSKKYKESHVEGGSLNADAVTREIESMSYGKAVTIGVAQSIAVIPGVSRSGATIVSGLALGMSREAIVEFSFFLAVPTMIAATGYDFIKSAHSFTGNQITLLSVGLIFSFILALVSIKFLLGFIKKRTFISFGIYRIVIAILFLLFLMR